MPELLTGPALYDTLGMRLHNEQSGSSSLYTHPYALEAVPLQDQQSPSATTPTAVIAKPGQTSPDTPRDVLEQRLNEAMASLNQHNPRANNQTLADHLSIFNRWYFRPEAKRIGEAIFCDPEKPLPVKADSSRHFASFSRKSNGRSSDIGVNSIQVPGEAL